MALIDMIAKGGVDIGPKLRQGFMDAIKSEEHQQNTQIRDMQIKMAQRKETQAENEELFKQKQMHAKTKEERLELQKEGAILYPKTMSEQTKTILSLKKKDLFMLDAQDEEVSQLDKTLQEAPPEMKQGFYSQLRDIAIKNGIPAPPEDYNDPKSQEFLTRQRLKLNHSRTLVKERAAQLKIKEIKAGIRLKRAQAGLAGSKARYFGRKGTQEGNKAARDARKLDKLNAQIKKIEATTPTKKTAALKTRKLKAEIKNLEAKTKRKKYAFDRKIERIMKFKGVTEEEAYEIATSKTRAAFEKNMALSLGKSGLYEPAEIKAKTKALADLYYKSKKPKAKPKAAAAVEKDDKEIEKQMAETPKQKTYSTPEELGEAYQSRKLTREQADAIAKEKGWE